MSNPIKRKILEYQLNKCHKKYKKKLAMLSDPYGMWISTMEDRTAGSARITAIKVCDFISLLVNGGDGAPAVDTEAWIAVPLTDGKYEMPSGSYDVIFSSQSEYGMAYSDEDMIDFGQNKRYGAWMKPSESPDTLLSFFYYGSLLFISGMHLMKYLGTDHANHNIAQWLADLKMSMTTDKKQDDMDNREIDRICERNVIYDFTLRYSEYLSENGLKIKHIPQVLFHGYGTKWEPENPKKPEVVNENAYWGYEPVYDGIKLDAMKRRKIRGKMEEHDFAGRIYSCPVYMPQKEDGTFPLVSIVIPSKDNVGVLKKCLYSLKEKTLYPKYEIILVDNGSCEENRLEILRLQRELGFEYIYEKMDFNFSKMCNIGARTASGDYILLLNDDMEIVQPDWLDIMVGQASISYIGAVGAKLLYPDSDVIQHVGITNLRVGPAHKLLKEHDSVDYYYGRNVLPYDMIGVTAACLLVGRKKYWQVGGFCEDIAVAYNDVDFCFSLYDNGYYNVIRNDVVLYHHESISRGDDALDEEKWDRLLKEKDFCYSRHLSLKGKDPFYNPNLAGFKHKYFCGYLYPYEQRLSFSSVEIFSKDIIPEWHNNCLMVTLEHVRLERKLDLEDERDVYWLEGWAYVLGMDSARYKKKIILINADETKKKFVIQPFDRYRQDVVDILPDQVNVALSGFSCRIKREDLQEGKYKIAVLFEDTCSRQKLYKECGTGLTVERRA